MKLRIHEMRIKLLALTVLLSLLSLSATVFAWDRYDNETEWYHSPAANYAFEAIISYQFSVSGFEDVVLETTNSTGDTYMYLWFNTINSQYAKDDDGGLGTCSKIETSLWPGTYTVFIRSFSSGVEGTCNLIKNGVTVKSNDRFSGTNIDLTYYPAETKFITKDLSPGLADTYCLLLNRTGDLIGVNDDYSNSRASSIEASEKPYNMIIGAFSASSEGTCKLAYMEDLHPEFLALCGSEDRHAVSGNQFIEAFDSADYPDAYTNALQLQPSIFTTPTRINYANQVDLIWVHAHGSPGLIWSHDDVAVDFTSSDGTSGSGFHTANRSGDLEYVAFLSCQVVRIESETSWDWLVDRGWKSALWSPGFFEGVHLVVGFHTNYTFYNAHGGTSHSSYYWHAKAFANNLDDGETVWDAWKHAYEDATDKIEHWAYCPDVDFGEISSIHIVPNQDDTLSDHNTQDYTYGDSGYYLGFRRYHYYYDAWYN